MMCLVFLAAVVCCHVVMYNPLRCDHNASLMPDPPQNHDDPVVKHSQPRVMTTYEIENPKDNNVGVLGEGNKLKLFSRC